MQNKLPNATISLVLGILSFIACCCTSGYGGVVLSGIALFLVKKDEKLYAENPENYSNYSQVNTSKIIAIIGLVLSALCAIYVSYLLITGEYDILMEQYMQTIQEMQENQ